MMAIPPPDPNFTGAQKTAYAKQYGGTWEGSRYNPTGVASTALKPVATAPKPATVAPKPAAVAPVAPPGYPGGGSSSYTSGGTPPGTTFTSTPTPGQPANIQNTFRDQLLKQLNTDVNNVKLTDPDLAPQQRAFQNAQQRSQERMQQDLAEQGFAGGALGTGAYGSDLRALEQQRGESEAQFDAGLLKEAKGLRTQNLFNALGMGQGQIQSDEALRQALNAANQQYSLGAQDIGLRKQLGQGQLGLGMLQAMLQDRQSNNRLGLDAGIAGQGFNQSAILAMLGLR
jgi:hypothetical protein